MLTTSTTDQLLAEAQQATRPDGQRIRTDRWLPVVEILRQKGWTWGAIYNWLAARGEPVQPNRHSFIASMSRRYRFWKNQSA